jgi:hypothetical protein
MKRVLGNSVTTVPVRIITTVSRPLTASSRISGLPMSAGASEVLARAVSTILRIRSEIKKKKHAYNSIWSNGPPIKLFDAVYVKNKSEVSKPLPSAKSLITQ